MLCSLQQWRRGKMRPSQQTRVQYICRFCFQGRETDSLIWNYCLLFPLISHTSEHEKVLSSLFQQPGYSPADDNPSPDRGGGEACFSQLPSAERTYQHRQLQSIPGKGRKTDLQLWPQKCPCNQQVLCDGKRRDKKNPRDRKSRVTHFPLSKFSFSISTLKGKFLGYAVSSLTDLVREERTELTVGLLCLTSCRVLMGGLHVSSCSHCVLSRLLQQIVWKLKSHEKHWKGLSNTDISEDRKSIPWG